MNVEILVSAMNQADMSIVHKMNCQSDVLIINQTDHEGYEETTINNHRIRMYSTTHRGLSHSRNMAMLHALGDICVFCDDDEIFEDGYGSIIQNAYERHPDADIIAFNYKDLSPRASRKIIEKEKPTLKWRTFSSVSLTFVRKKIINKGVWFNHIVGAGSGVINSGEETAWQNLAVKNDLIRWECPYYITTVLPGKSTWFSGFNEQYFYDLGANLYINHKSLRYILQFYYLYRFRNVESIPNIAKLKWMINGMKGIKSGVGYEQFNTLNK